MIAVDSSVVVAGFGAWHEQHGVAREVLADLPRLVAHAELESYSVLTRLPDPFRAAPALVAEFLRRLLPGPRLVLSGEDHDGLVERLAAWGVSGGAAFDALIGLTAAAAGRELLTLDARAMGTYRRCGVAARLLVDG